MVSSNKILSGKQYISFDLDTNELKKYYPTENWRNAYEDIKKYMQKNGFDWLQGSGYISTEMMNAAKAHNIVNNLIKNNLWIHKCMRDCRVFDVGKTNDLNILFDKSVEVPVRSGYQKEDKDYQKKHIQELKRNGFQPGRDIVAKMEKLDKVYGRYVDLKEVRDIYKGEKQNVPTECRQLANEIGRNLKNQELARVSYR